MTKDKICECPNCGWSGPESELGSDLSACKDLAGRLDPGSIVPVGECPRCSVFAYYQREGAEKSDMTESAKLKAVIANAIAANLAALSQRLTESADLARAGHEAMKREGSQNLAIGTVLSLEQMLPEAQALFAAAIALHRGSR